MPMVIHSNGNCKSLAKGWVVRTVRNEAHFHPPVEGGGGDEFNSSNGGICYDCFTKTPRRMSVDVKLTSPLDQCSEKRCSRFFVSGRRSSTRWIPSRRNCAAVPVHKEPNIRGMLSKEHWEKC